MNAFITAISAFLPGEAVENDALDEYLGKTGRISARTRQMILAGNGIQTRYYAIDPATGKTSFTNARLAAAAVRRLGFDEESKEKRLECLCCGTSSADQIMPGHASMVHGELGGGPCEVISTSGICLSGITAMKYAAMSVSSGMSKNAVATGSELASTYMRQDFFLAAAERKKKNGVGKQRHLAFSFEADFLRWMLSDGAGAVLIEPEPASGKLSLQINWIELISHAHRLETCMYAGALKQEDGSLVGWRDCIRTGKQEGVFTIKQDARLLNKEIIRTMVGQSLPLVIDKYALKPKNIDWFLPHYSSDFFREPLKVGLRKIGFPLPDEKWFTNLRTKGNTGSASFYIMLEELFSSGRLRQGDRILGMIPESGRFSVGWVLLTVV
ncbi:MAG: beta-ketoacyl-ACP synthase III [Candidatus Electrothrix sp. Rat3]|nr:beta-ketoacyl-ACP synthase III [Candidatus Electrothrix rattekaaiensis]